jgi:acyl carrier protein
VSRPDEVREQLTDILVQVVGCAPDEVVDRAKLQDLGVDSLAIVEMADELGRRFDLYISDDKVNGLRTVSDAVDSVVHHDGSRSTRSTTYEPLPMTLDEAPSETVAVASPPPPPIDPEERNDALRRLALWFAVVGAVVGVVLGLGSAALVGATGLKSSNLPPIALPTTPAPTTATPTPTPTPTPSDDATIDPDPTLNVESTEVKPGEHIALKGNFPGLSKGETLQVQVKDPGEKWDKFPVTTKIRDDAGAYATEIYTSRTGKREFRLKAEDSGKTTPSVSITIG